MRTQHVMSPRFIPSGQGGWDRGTGNMLASALSSLRIRVLAEIVTRSVSEEKPAIHGIPRLRVGLLCPDATLSFRLDRALAMIHARWMGVSCNSCGTMRGMRQRPPCSRKVRSCTGPPQAVGFTSIVGGSRSWAYGESTVRGRRARGRFERRTCRAGRPV